MTLTTGKLLKAFYADPLYWPANETGYAHSGERIVVNGEPQDGRDTSEVIGALDDNDHVQVSGGEVWGGNIDVNDEPSFEARLDQWLSSHADIPDAERS